MVALAVGNYNSACTRSPQKNPISAHPLVASPPKRDNGCAPAGEANFVRSEVPPARLPGHWRTNPKDAFGREAGQERHLRPTAYPDARHTHRFTVLAMRLALAG